ncbi:hypothetical protein EDD99_5649 [Streptomyces sp. 846.5]|nr:hypothetical protein EDD99_5649 [Streptomyces sp. 846.5]
MWVPSQLSPKVIAPGAFSIGLSDSGYQPLSLAGVECRQCGPEVLLVLRPGLMGLVEELHLWRQVGHAFWRGPSQKVYWTPDLGTPPRKPVLTLRLIEHDLDPPWLQRVRPAPDVVDFGGQDLSGLPRPQGPRRVCRPPLPSRQQLLNDSLVAPEHKNVDIAVLSERVADREFDGVASGHPPRDFDRREQRRYVGQGCRFPRPPRRLGACHSARVLLCDHSRNRGQRRDCSEMAKLRREMHRRMLGNGYCARPVEMDCHFESICESCKRSSSPPSSSVPLSNANEMTRPRKARLPASRSSRDCSVDWAKRRAAPPC